jgi:glycosyltransferase involved in cell wall biosynthesis
LEMFLNNSSLACRLGFEARQVAEHRLSWDILADRLEATYFALLGESPWPISDV